MTEVIHSISDFEKYLKDTKKVVEEALDFSLGPENPEILRESMRYSLLAGGKRIRPILCLASCSLAGGDPSLAVPTAVAIEMIHTMSLIHDDLPAMDNDDLRRGNATCHKKFDDATAILVGDAFQSLAFQILTDKKTHNDSSIRCRLVEELTFSAGLQGMVGGQMLDLEAEKKTLNLKDIYQLQSLKTGELFRFSCIAPCILADKEEEIEIFSKFSSKLGLAFQIKDDLLDVEGDEMEIGKKTGKDKTRGKETLISLLGVENAKIKSQELISEAIKDLEPYGNRAESLINLTNFIIERKK